MIRVLLVSEARGFGGAEVYLERLASSFRDARAEIAVPRRAAMDVWRARLAAAGTLVLEVDPGPAGAFRLAARIRRARHDIVHVNLPGTYDGGCGLLPWLLARIGGRPVVVTEHLTLLGRSRRRRALKRLTTGGVRAIVTVSEASRRALAGEGIDGGRVRVIPNGVPGPPVPPPLPAAGGPLRIGVLASLEPRKGIDVLLRAAAQAGDGIVFQVAGEGPLRGVLEGLRASLGVPEPRFRFVGRVDDAFAFLSGCHVLALASRLEAMPLSVLEAFACGRGALVSALPGMDEIVRDGVDGRLLPVDDVGAWKAALVDLAARPGTGTAWGAAARREYETRFTLERCAAETEALYRAVLTAGKG